MKKYAVLAAGAILFANPAYAVTILDTSLLNLPGGTSTNGTPTGALGTAGKVSSSTSGSGASVSTSNKDQWIQTNVRSGASVGITNYQARDGNGSAVFASPTTNGKADLEYRFSTAVSLTSVLGGSYDWFRDVASTNPGAQAPVFRLILGNAAGNAFSSATYLIFEPTYNGVGTAPEGSWQTSTFGLNSTFWVNNNNINKAAGIPSCTSGGTCFDSLADWISVNQSLTVVGLSLGVGSGWAGNFLGAVDNVSYNFGTAGSNSFNFEVAGLSAVPESATWAMMIVGLGVVGASLRRRRTTVSFA